MRIIILTKDKKDGLRLLDSMLSLIPTTSNIESFTKEEVLSDNMKFSDTQYIFSTWYMPLFTEHEINHCFPSLKAIFYAAGTVRYFAEPFLKKGIRVFSAAKANAIPVAEFTVAQIILANKGYFQAQREEKSVMWRWAYRKARLYAEQRPGNYDSKIGIIGCGSVGSEVARLLKSYHLDVYVYDPYLPVGQCNKLGVKSVGLEELFEICDVVSNHLPDIPSTQGMINYKFLNRLKDYSTFINTGRGKQVNEADLSKLLRKRSSICALLDVSCHEPLFPWSSLLRRKNVFLSPHIAGSMGNEYNRMVEYMMMAYDDVTHNRDSSFEVSLNMLDNLA